MVLFNCIFRSDLKRELVCFQKLFESQRQRRVSNVWWKFLHGHLALFCCDKKQVRLKCKTQTLVVKCYFKVLGTSPFGRNASLLRFAWESKKTLIFVTWISVFQFNPKTMTCHICSKKKLLNNILYNSCSFIHSHHFLLLSLIFLFYRTTNFHSPFAIGF